MGQSKLLHTANVLVSILGTVAAETVTGGAGAAVSGLLSLKEIVHRFNGQPPDLSRQVADLLEQALGDHHVSEAHRQHIPQIIDLCRLTPAEIMAAARRPDEICTLMLHGLTDPALAEAGTQDAFRRVVTPLLRDLLARPEVTASLQPAFQDAVAESLRFIGAQVERLARETSDTAKRLGAQEALVCDMARRYAPGSEGDFDSARLGLEQALEANANQKQRAELPSNLDSQVKSTLAEVVRLNDLVRLAEGKAVLDAKLAALADEMAERNQARLALFGAGVDQARAMNDAESAAGYVLARLAVEPGPDAFEALRAEQDEWFVRGRDKGVSFDLEVSIHLARASYDRAQGADQRGAALNNLGNTLSTLGERESGTAQLEQAVAAYRAALEERTRDRVPLQWAMTQNNLGAALQTLGERESGTARLEQAAVAFRAALEERTRERVPLQWAMTQMNLGSALVTLGERESGTARLEEAVAAYRAALEEYTRERVPLQWAMTQMNLGNALATLGRRESGSARLEGAAAAYRAALKEYTRERVPLDWAMTQFNLALLDRAFHAKAPDPARLVAAREKVLAAREVFAKGSPHDVKKCDALLARIDALEAGGS